MKHRVQIDLDMKALKSLDEVGRLLQTTSRAETVRRCVRAVLKLHERKGKEVLVL